MMVFNLKETEILSLRTGKKLQEKALKKYFLLFPSCAEVLGQNMKTKCQNIRVIPKSFRFSLNLSCVFVTIQRFRNALSRF